MLANDHAWPTFDPGSFTTVGGTRWTKWVRCFQWNSEREREISFSPDAHSHWFKVRVSSLNCLIKWGPASKCGCGCCKTPLIMQTLGFMKKNRFRDKKEATVFLSAQVIKITYSPLGCWEQPGRKGGGIISGYLWRILKVFRAALHKFTHSASWMGIYFKSAAAKRDRERKLDSGG